MIKILVFIFAVLGAAWTFLTGWEETPVTERRQLVGVDAETMASLGRQAYGELLGKARIVESGETAETVARISERLAAVADDMAGAEREWTVRLVTDDTPNAFALPGGYVVVMTGMLPVAGDADGLAAVIGHEMAHVIARHGAERMTQQKIAELGQLAAAAVLGDADPGVRAAVLGALGLGAQFGVLMPFSRKHEAEADEIGLLLMARACFDPRVAPRLWQRMAERNDGQPPEFASTHPSHESRTQALEAAMDEALAAREAAGCPPLVAQATPPRA